MIFITLQKWCWGMRMRNKTYGKGIIYYTWVMFCVCMCMYMCVYKISSENKVEISGGWPSMVFRKEADGLKHTNCNAVFFKLQWSLKSWGKMNGPQIATVSREEWLEGPRNDEMSPLWGWKGGNFRGPSGLVGPEVEAIECGSQTWDEPAHQSSGVPTQNSRRGLILRKKGAPRAHWQALAVCLPHA